MAPCQTPPANLVWQGRKDQWFEVTIRFNGANSCPGRLRRCPGTCGLLAPKKELPEPIRKANHKLVLRKAAGPYNYPAQSTYSSHLTERQSMARVTVEDCIDKVDNRFDLVLLAAHRARMISSGSQLTVDRDNDKNPVVSLREIADSTISPEDLREELVHSLQKFVEVDEPEPDTVPLIGSAGASVDADDTEVAVERMTEEELLKGLEGLAPPEEQPEEDE